MQSIRFSLKLDFCILFAVLAFLIPGPLLLSWLAAVAIHELSHFIALRLFRVRIYSLSMGYSGAEIQTQPMELKEEIICVLAGPLGGIATILLLHIFPYVTLFGFAQSMFNLLPVYPLDGGRILQRLLRYYFPDRADWICKIIRTVVMILSAVVIVFVFRAWQFILVATVLYLLKRKGLKFPCKARKQIVQ